MDSYFTPCSPTGSIVIQNVNSSDAEESHTRQTFANRLLTYEPEKDVNRVWLEKQRACNDVYAVWVATLPDLGKSESYGHHSKSRTLTMCCRWLQTRGRHYDLSICKASFSDLFFILKAPDGKSVRCGMTHITLLFT